MLNGCEIVKIPVLPSIFVSNLLPNLCTSSSCGNLFEEGVLIRYCVRVLFEELFLHPECTCAGIPEPCRKRVLRSGRVNDDLDIRSGQGGSGGSATQNRYEHTDIDELKSVVHRLLLFPMIKLGRVKAVS